MTTEDYVSYETAKLLKEKGFDWETHRSYLVNDNVFIPGDINDVPQRKDAIRIPTLQMAIKWLREKHNIGIFPSLFAFCVGEGGAAKPTYGTKIISLKSCELLTDDVNPMPTYEETCEAAIKYCLENLIEI